MYLFIIFIVLFTACAAIIAVFKAHWLVKTCLIVFLIMSSLLSFSIIQSREGKPVYRAELPPDVIVYGVVVDELGGYVYLLYNEVGDNEMPPLYVKTDYTKPLHQAAAEGKRQKKGEPFRMKTKKKKGGKDGDKKGDRASKGKDGENRGASMSAESFTHHVFELPPTLLPKKDY